MSTQFTAPDFISDISQNGGKLLVVVVGAGGTGSALLGKLFQLNNVITSLGGDALDVVVFDDDTVSPSNVGRQAYYPFDVGRNKSEVLVERFSQFGGDAGNWRYSPTKFHSGSLNTLTTFRHKGVIIFGCVDNAQGRIEMHKAMKNQRNCIYIDAGNAQRSGNVIGGMKAVVGKQEVYYPTVYDLYRTQLDEWQPVAGDSCSHEESIRRQDFGLNDVMAFHSVQILWQLLRHGVCQYQTVSVDLELGITSHHGADPEYWSMFGFGGTATH
jgi:PRTRC genetic system ThiF family protein